LLATSHTRRVLSSDADSRYLPPLWNTSPRTQLSWPICHHGNTTMTL
jgi:hypothetical protein